MVNTEYRPRLSRLAAAITAVFAAHSGFTVAQDVKLEEVTVVARKLQENVQDIPMTINVFSETEIDRLGIANTEDVIKYNPGMTLTHGIGGDDVRPDLRGVTSLSGRSNVAILVDGVDQTSDALIGTGAGQLISLDLYDLQQVEVVRGPQSALFGRNAFAGAINYITRRPSDTFEAQVGADAGTDDLLKGNVSVTGPITDDLRYRVNIAHKKEDGQYDHPITGKNLGDEKTTAGALAFEWDATDALNFLARVDYADQQIGESPIALGELNACTRLSPINPNDPTDREEIRTEGVCDLIPFVQSPTSIGELKGDQDDIHLSTQGTDGVSNKIFTMNLQTEWETDKVTIFANTAYTHHDADNEYDLDAQPTVTSLPSEPSINTTSSLANFSFPWVNEDNPFNYVYDAENQRDVYFQDLRASFKTGDDIDWMVGGEYYYEDYSQKDYQRANEAINRGNVTATSTVTTAEWVDVDSTDFFPASDSLRETLELTGTLPRDADRKTNAFGIYAAMNWLFADDWQLNLSARYQQEDISIEYGTLDPTYVTPMFEDQKPGVFYASDPYTGGPCPGPISPNGKLCARTATGEPIHSGPRKVTGSENFDAFNPRASLTWHYNDDHMFYGSVAQGTKPGGFNFESLLLAENVVYDQEKLTTYETGWKGKWWEDRILFNGAIYYNKNKDKQASANQPALNGNPPVPFVENIGDAESYGLELSNTVLITDHLRLDWSYSYIHAQYDGFVRTRSDGASIVDLSGEELPRTPKHSGIVSLQYNLPVGEADLYARTDVIYRDEMIADDLGWATLPEMTTIDMQIGWIKDKWEIIGYVNNITDEDELVSGVGFVNFQQQFQNMYTTTLAVKRNGGIRAKYRF
ncbi:MAG: TonB-dependent receptor [Halioglobus sp.]|nr:TonB-dependent receptor [Halioglobus sp.]